MALTGEGFQNIGENFEEYEGKINAGKNNPEIAEIIGNHRADLFFLLAKNKIEGTDDENNLQKLQTALETKKKDAEKDLGNYKDFDFTNDTALQTLWESIAKQSGSNLFIPGGIETHEPDHTSLKDSINTILQNLQYLHFDFDGTQETSWHLFEKPINESSGTGSGTLLKKLYNEKNDANINNHINNILNDKKDNEFYISKGTITKLENPARDTAIRIALYCYAILKICEKNQLSTTLKSKAETVLKQIQDDFLPKLKLIYNAYTQLKKVKVGYETVQKVNKCIDTQIENGDLSTNKKEISINLENAFKDKTGPSFPLDFNEYNIETKNIEIKDGSGKRYPVSIKGTSIVSRRNITVKNKGKIEADLQIEIGGQKISIGKMSIDTTSSPQEAKIKFFDNTTLQSNASTVGINIPFNTLTYTIPLQGTVLTGAVPQLMVAATKTITGTLTGITATAPVPPTPTPTPSPVPPSPTPTPSPTPPPYSPTSTDTEINASLSAMGTREKGGRFSSDKYEGFLKEKFEQEAKEELRKEYNNYGKGDLWHRIKYYAGQKLMLDKKVKEKMKKVNGDVFTGDTTLDSQTQEVTNRHQMEKNLNLGDVIADNITLTPAQQYELDTLAGKFLSDGDEKDFQDKFNEYMKTEFSYNEKEGTYTIPTGTGTKKLDNIEHIGTNLLLQLKQKKERYTLVEQIKNQIDSLSANGGTVTLDSILVTNIDKTISDYIQKTGDTADQLVKSYLQLKTTNTETDLNILKGFLNHQKACMNIAKTNTKVSLQLLTNGKDAYHIDNKDRENGITKWATWMKKHPGLTTGISVGVGGLISLLTAGVATPWVVGILTGTTTFARNFGDLTDQEKQFSEKIANDFEAAQKECQTLQDAIDHTSNRNLYKKQKLKRQKTLYENTMNMINKTGTKNNSIEQVISKLTPLITDININSDPTKKAALEEYLAKAWAMIKFHKTEGHPFLYSKNKEKSEEEMNQLFTLVEAGCQRIGKNQTSFESMTFYTDTYKKLNEEYQEASKNFNRTRRIRGVTNGALMAALAGGTSYLLNNKLSFGKDQAPVSQINAGGDDPLTGNVNLGLHDLTDGSNAISQGFDNVFNDIPPATDLSGATIDLQYGAGTDATQYIPGHEPTMADLTNKINDITTTVNSSSLSGTQKQAFIDALKDISNNVNTSAGYHNEYLQAMRQAEFLDQAVKSLPNLPEDVTINISHNPAFDIAGRTAHDAASRVIQGSIHISRDAIDGSQAFNYGKYIAGLPGWGFWNTVKKDPDKEK